MKNNCYIFIVSILALLLSSCSFKNSEPQGIIEDQASLEAEGIAAPSREAVFLYNDAKTLPKRVALNLAGEPVLLPSGYVRLVGVVSGGKPIACLEIGGRGLALGKGEMVNDYRIIGIAGDRVVLERGK